MLLIDCKTCTNQLDLCRWPYLGKMIFWSISTVTLLMWALIGLLRVLWCPKHRGLSHRTFLQLKHRRLSHRTFLQLKHRRLSHRTFLVKILEKQWRFKLSNYAQKLHGGHGNMHEGRSVELSFSEWKFTRKISNEADTANSKTFWRNSVILVRAQRAPGLVRVKEWEKNKYKWPKERTAMM